jgi:hypothetical protein
MQSMLGRWVMMNRVTISAEEAKPGEMSGMEKCVVCNCELEEEKIRHIKIKGKPKKICQECVTAIKGLA